MKSRAGGISLKDILRLLNSLTFGFFLKNHFLIFPEYVRFWRAYFGYKKMIRNTAPALFLDLQPHLFEATNFSTINYHYFYQDTWVAGKIFEAKPAIHVDIGSTVLLTGILSQFTKVTSIEVRPLDVKLKNLEALRGDVRHLPLEDNSVVSLSSLCVIEHIGLGRYGDELDPGGTDKAIEEFQRVLAPGGNLYISVPVGSENKVCFNAHRIFEPKSFIRKFDKSVLADEKYVQGNHVYEANDFDSLDHAKEIFGLFHFVKKA